MFVRDLCGIVCIVVTYVAILYADYVVIRWIIIHTMQDSLWGPFHAIAFNIVILLLTISHLKAVLSDPGLVPLPQTRMDFSDIYAASSEGEDYDEKDDWTVCAKCETYRPPRAHHCRICRRCIRRMDHHCPWINNCVGERNQKYFIQFLIYVGALSMYATGLVIMSWVNDCLQCSDDITIRQSRILHSVILILESVLFGIFVVAILIYQFQAIFDDETAVEKVQGTHSHRRNKRMYALLAQVCGKSHPVFWLLPCHNPPLYRDKHDPLLNHHV